MKEMNKNWFLRYLVTDDIQLEPAHDKYEYLDKFPLFLILQDHIIITLGCSYQYS